MVDGVYRYRSDKTNIKLNDSGVRRILDERRESAANFVGDLDAELAGSPELSYFVVLLRPTAARYEMLRQVLHGPGRDTTLLQAVSSAGHDRMTHLVMGRVTEPPPQFRDLRSVEPAADGGVVLTNAADRPERHLEVEIGEDGQVRLLCGRGPDHVAVPPWVRAGDGENTAVSLDLPVLRPSMYVILARRAFLFTAGLADLAGYRGGWQVGVAAKGLGGAINGDMPEHAWVDLPRYKGHRHNRVTTATTDELASAPGRVVERVLGSLLRSMDAVRTSGALLESPPITS
jgi:hypothetical protein